MIIAKRINVTHKSGGKIIRTQTIQQSFGCARVMEDAQVAEEVAAVATPKSFSVKPTVKAAPSNTLAEHAEVQSATRPSIQSATHKSGSLSNRRQTFTYGEQTVMIH